MKVVEYIKFKELSELYEFKVLDYKDDVLVNQAATVLADTFLGVKIGNSYISEPMMVSSSMSKESFREYLLDVIRVYGKQGLCTIAIDKELNEVVGCIVAELAPDEINTELLEGELSDMNIVNLATDNLINRYYEEEIKKGNKPSSSTHAHLFLVGIKTKLDKKYIAEFLCLELENVLVNKGIKSIFTFSSNIRSQGMFKKCLGYTNAKDENGEIIKLVYKEDEFFNKIPEDVAPDGQILVKDII